MMALHGIGAAHDRPGRRAEADGVITLVLDGLRRSRSMEHGRMPSKWRPTPTDRRLSNLSDRQWS
ncbi:hypothetical protein [Nonomuraea mesophila]|uniref:hypothetical protein n=1 Tax=Nonomuraea mesophila TaxID=2530382 RepID=UPI001C709580|nr:hypothetical protein [Nonomuraea mesophila]